GRPAQRLGGRPRRRRAPGLHLVVHRGGAGGPRTRARDPRPSRRRLPQRLRADPGRSRRRGPGGGSCGGGHRQVVSGGRLRPRRHDRRQPGGQDGGRSSRRPLSWHHRPRRPALVLLLRRGRRGGPRGGPREGTARRALLPLRRKRGDERLLRDAAGGRGRRNAPPSYPLRSGRGPGLVALRRGGADRPAAAPDPRGGRRLPPALELLQRQGRAGARLSAHPAEGRPAPHGRVAAAERPGPMSLTPGETKRKLLHIAVGGFALLMRYMDWTGAALMAFAAFVHNWLVLPRIGGRALWRSDEHDRGFPRGILIYPLS